MYAGAPASMAPGKSSVGTTRAAMARTACSSSAVKKLGIGVGVVVGEGGGKLSSSPQPNKLVAGSAKATPPAKPQRKTCRRVMKSATLLSDYAFLRGRRSRSGGGVSGNFQTMYGLSFSSWYALAASTALWNASSNAFKSLLPIASWTGFQFSCMN